MFSIPNVLFVLKSLIICIIIAGTYGIIHDQVTYSISQEYFTKFKYVQFGFEPQWFGGHRQTVGVIGFLASWWVGFILGFFLSIICMILIKDSQKRSRTFYKSVFTIYLITIFSGILGFIVGKYYLIKTSVDWWLPENLQDVHTFIIVGSIHNFGYSGATLGFLTSISKLIYRSIKIKRTKNLY